MELVDNSILVEKKWKSSKQKKIVFAILIIASILVTLKSIFVSLQMDEEYAISLSYRLLKGDKLITQIWDPHQTSAFLMEWLMWGYIKLFHTTEYLVIFIRVVGTLLQFGVTFYLYKILRHVLNRERSFLLAMIYFNLSPKTYVMPEFSNMMVWGLTLMLIALTRLAVLEGRLGIYNQTRGFYEKSKIAVDHWNLRMAWASIEVGLWLCFIVLAYPSCVIMFPFVIIYLWDYDQYQKYTIPLVTITCVLAGGLYMLYLFSYMTPAQLVENLQSLMASNGAHGGGWGMKLWIYTSDLGMGCLFGVLYLAVTIVLGKIVKVLQARRSILPDLTERKKKVLTWVFQMLLAAFGLQFLHWILMLWEYESSYPYTIYFFLIGFALYLTPKMKPGDREMAWLWLGSNLVMYVAILLLTNLTIFTSIKYLMPGVMMAFTILIIYARDHAADVGRRYIRVTLLVWCCVTIFVKGWQYIDNDGLMKNITSVGNIIDVGPGKGIFTEYMQGYMQESEYNEFQTLLQPGDNLLVMDSNTMCYMYQEVNFAGPSTLCTPTFDANLLDYWQRNPEKYPTVIAVQCWYGELRENADYDWMMSWIETEYQATEIVDGEYYRYYIKR